jgi:hypothetical protein
MRIEASRVAAMEVTSIFDVLVGALMCAWFVFHWCVPM